MKYYATISLQFIKSCSNNTFNFILKRIGVAFQLYLEIMKLSFLITECNSHFKSSCKTGGGFWKYYLAYFIVLTHLRKHGLQISQGSFNLQVKDSLSIM